MGWAAWRTAFSSLAARIMLTKHLENKKALFSVDADLMSFTIFKSVLILDCQYTRCNSARHYPVERKTVRDDSKGRWRSVEENAHWNVVACDVSLNVGNSFAL